MRHLILEEPVSRSAVWSVRLAWFGLAVTLVAVALLRFGSVELTPGLVALGAGLSFALTAAVLALLAFIRIWTEGRRGFDGPSGASSSRSRSSAIRAGSSSAP